MFKCLILIFIATVLLVILYAFHFLLLGTIKIFARLLKIDISLKKTIQKIRTNLVIEWGRATNKRAVIVRMSKTRKVVKKHKIRKAA